jgi:hypothetical protein
MMNVVARLVDLNADKRRAGTVRTTDAVSFSASRLSYLYSSLSLLFSSHDWGTV